MIRIKNPETNRDILIMWKHKIPQQASKFKMDARRSKLSSKQETGSTTCFICDDNKESVIVHADAVQSKHDQFSRKIGRRVSFERAINEAELTRDVRRLVWNAYLNTCNVL